MVLDPDKLRIGDEERDETVHLLREHYAAGRLNRDELETRMGAALGARTGSELLRLLDDLPGPRPGLPAAQLQKPQQLELDWPDEAPPARKRGAFGRPWLVQIVLLMAAIIAAVLSRGELVWLIPVAAIWLWVVPSFRDISQVKPHPAQRQLTYPERQELIGLLGSKNKIVAIKRYRELTGAGLKEAKDDVEALQRQELI